MRISICWTAPNSPRWGSRQSCGWGTRWSSCTWSGRLALLVEPRSRYPVSSSASKIRYRQTDMHTDCSWSGRQVLSVEPDISYTLQTNRQTCTRTLSVGRLYRSIQTSIVRYRQIDRHTHVDCTWSGRQAISVDPDLSYTLQTHRQTYTRTLSVGWLYRSIQTSIISYRQTDIHMGCRIYVRQ